MENTKNSFDKEKYESWFPARLRDLTPNAESIKKLAEGIGVTVQAVSQYRNATAFPKIETLIKIAHHFGVSLDYLIKMSDVKTPNSTIQGACECTGLSQEAVENIRNSRPAILAILNKVLSSDVFFKDFLYSIHSLGTYAEKLEIFYDQSMIKPDDELGNIDSPENTYLDDLNDLIQNINDDEQALLLARYKSALSFERVLQSVFKVDDLSHKAESILTSAQGQFDRLLDMEEKP